VKSYLVTAILQYPPCKCEIPLPTAKLNFVVDADNENLASQQARRLLRHMTKATVLAIEVDLARWES